MMRVLLVEDDGFKEEAVARLLNSKFQELEIVVERSVQTAVERTSAGPFDLIVLDIALPSHDRSLGAGNPTSMPSGGLEVLLRLNQLHRSDPVLILTQYPEVEIWGDLVGIKNLSTHLKEQIDVNVIGVILFDQSKANWTNEFLSRLERRR